MESYRCGHYLQTGTNNAFTVVGYHTFTKVLCDNIEEFFFFFILQYSFLLYWIDSFGQMNEKLIKKQFEKCLITLEMLKFATQKKCTDILHHSTWAEITLIIWQEIMKKSGQLRIIIFELYHCEHDLSSLWSENGFLEVRGQNLKGLKSQLTWILRLIDYFE